MEDDLKTRIKAWVDSYNAQTEGYIDPDYLNDVLMTCGVKIRFATRRIEEYAPLVAVSRHAKNVLPEYQKKLEWGHALSAELEEQLARFPPLPVLPPTAPLIKLSGVVDEVGFTKGMVCFDAEVYTTVRDELERKRRRDNIGALVAMSAQMLAGSQPHAMIKDGKLNKQKSLHVKGKVDGKSFAGWFGMTDIRPGDQVEMAAMPDGDNYLIYAIINVSRGTISVTPNCMAGKSAYPLHLWVLFSFLFVSVPFIPFFIGCEFAPTFGVYIVASLALSAATYRRMMNQDGPMFALYAQIAEALEFPGGGEFRLLRHSGKISKPKKDAGDIQIRKEGDIPVPQGWIREYSHEYFYHY